MKRVLRPALTALAVTVIALLLVGGVTLHREGLYALPGEMVIVRFPSDTPTPIALERLADAGTTLVSVGPGSMAYRAHVLDAAAPRRLAEDAWVFRDPFDSLAQCFGFGDHPRRRIDD